RGWQVFHFSACYSSVPGGGCRTTQDRPGRGDMRTLSSRLNALRFSAGSMIPALLLFPALVLAQTIYIWEDEDGIKHFTDQKPETDREVTVQRARAEPQRLIDTVKSGSRDAPV